jgi:hypothetical protein
MTLFFWNESNLPQYKGCVSHCVFDEKSFYLCSAGSMLGNGHMPMKSGQLPSLEGGVGGGRRGGGDASSGRCGWNRAWSEGEGAVGHV